MSSQFGPYWMLRRIGLGDLAEVFVALRATVERDSERAALSAGLIGPLRQDLVAVKRISREMAAYDEVHRMLEQEGRLGTELDHPNVVRVFDVGKVAGRPYIAMEYVPGSDLGRLLDRAQPGRLAPGPALRVVLDICAALAYVHEARDREGRHLRVVHGDVTPTNILVSTAGVAKLIDFSVAVSELSQAGDTTVRGTYGYMSPEQVRGERLDPRTDVFAVGVVLWELLSGRRLFRRRANYLTLAAVVEDPVPRLSDLAELADSPGAPGADVFALGTKAAELDRILARALAKRREDRYDSVAQLAAELGPVAEQLGWDLQPWTLKSAVRSLLSSRTTPIAQARS